MGSRTPRRHRVLAGGLCAALAIWLAAPSPAVAQQGGQEAARKWAGELITSLRAHKRHKDVGTRVALRPLYPGSFAGLTVRQRRQLYEWLLHALGSPAYGYNVVDPVRFEDISRVLESTADPNWWKRYLKVLKEAEARVSIVCRGTPGGERIVLSCSAVDITDGVSLGGASASFELKWLSTPIALPLAIGSIAGDIAANLPEPGFVDEVRILDARTDSTSPIAKYIAGSLKTETFRKIKLRPGWRPVGPGEGGGRASYRLDGEIRGFDDETLVLDVMIYSKSTPVHAVTENIALSSVPSELRSAHDPGPGGAGKTETSGKDAALLPPDDPRAVQRDKYTVGMDAAFEAGDHGKVLSYVGELERLGGALPARAEHFRGAAYFHRGRPGAARAALNRYVGKAGRQGRYYRESLKLLLAVDEQDEAAFARAKSGDTAESYGAYLSAWPDGEHAAEVKRLRAAAAAREEAAVARAERERIAREKAARAADDAAFARARSGDTAESYGAYLSSWPQGRHAAAAGRLRSAAAARGEDGLGLDRAGRAAVQRGLAALGGEVGSADGVFGRRTRSAIGSWQRAKGYEATGYLTRAQADALIAAGVGAVFRDCAECPEMVVVPSGSFMMGSPSSEEERDDDEGPVHRVRIPRPFAVGKHEVTFAEWDACVRGGGCGGYRPDDRGWGRGRRPVIEVIWNDAKSYVRWLIGKTGKPYRLLSESEWEYAARAGTRTPFHTGRTISTDQANYNGNYTYGSGRKGVYRKKTVPVGSFDANGFGLHDMRGNVWEWVEDCWNDSYAGAPSDGRAWKERCGSYRVSRGGSWYNDPRYLRSANRNRVDTGNRNNDIGFRVARTLD